MTSVDGIFEYRSRNRPMMATEKLAVVTVHMCVCFVYSPIFVFRDLIRAEARLRCLDVDPICSRDDTDLSLWNHEFVHVSVPRVRPSYRACTSKN